MSIGLKMSKVDLKKREVNQWSIPLWQRLSLIIQLPG